MIRGASNHADRNIISIAFLWFDFHISCEEITGPQLFCIVYLSSTSPSSQTGGCFCTLAIAVTEILSAVNINTSTISDLIIISQLNHFTFVSALLFPILRLNLALPLQSIPRTRYRRLAKPYPTGFSCYIQSAYKSKQNFLSSHYFSIISS